MNGLTVVKLLCGVLALLTWLKVEDCCALGRYNQGALYAALLALEVAAVFA